jgi:predicted HAD superfamily phosphohydrolase YqeG
MKDMKGKPNPETDITATKEMQMKEQLCIVISDQILDKVSCTMSVPRHLQINSS